MPRRIILSAFAIAVTAIAASAADLPVQSGLGAIFAEPAEVRLYTYRSREYSAPIIAYNLLPPMPWARGGYYYGSPWSYYYPGPYYGGPYDTDGLRLPYACGLYGYCRELSAQKTAAVNRRTGWMQDKGQLLPPTSFAKVSRKPMVRLNTGRSGVESGSRTK